MVVVVLDPIQEEWRHGRRGLGRLRGGRGLRMLLQIILAEFSNLRWALVLCQSYPQLLQLEPGSTYLRKGAVFASWKLGEVYYDTRRWAVISKLAF